MGNREEAVIETKLGILIDDFQRFRIVQSETNKQLLKHGMKRETSLARIESTLGWHTTIGTFLIGTLMTLVWIHANQ